MPINFTEMEKVLIGLKKGFSFINPSELITLDDIKKLIELKNKYTMSYIRQCIKKCESKQDRIFFNVERRCYDCSTILHIAVSKTELENIIQEIGKQYRCKDCEKKLKEQKKAKAELSKQNEENRRVYTTNMFITNYLNPECSWNIPPKNWYRALCSEYHSWFIDTKAIKDFISSMDYKDFLQTPYWKAISMHVRYKSGYKCQVCNSKKFLNVHHRSYKHHGEEINHLEDLIVLCNNCHSTFHINKQGVN